ncbi:MAG: hypothetical protein ACI3Z7_03880 [Candidatus Aphodosoma sp.]
MKKALFLLSCGLILAACTNLDLDNLDDVTYSPSLLVPLGSITTDVAHLVSSVDSTNIKVDDETKTIYFEYLIPEQSVYPIDVDKYAHGAEMNIGFQLADNPTLKDLFDLIPPDMGIDGIPLPAGQFDFSVKQEYIFDFDDIGSDETEFLVYGCHVNKADFQVNVNVDGITLSDQTYFVAEINFPTVELIDGQPLVFTERITSNTSVLKKKYEGFLLSFMKDKEDNRVPMDISFKLHSDGSTTANRHAAINLSVQFQTMGFKDLTGYFYQQSPLVSGDSVINIGGNAIWDNFTGGSKFLFHDPEVTLELTHNVGIPFEFDMNRFGASDKDGNKVCLDFNGSPSRKIKIPAATMNADGSVEPVQMSLVFNRENGATNRLFTIMPETMEYDWDIYANSKDESQTHFVTSDLFFNVKGRLVAPFVFDAGTVFSYDTIMDMDLSGILPSSDTLTVETLKLFCDIANSVPVAIGIQLDFLDADGNILFRGSNTVVEAAVVDDGGKAVAPSGQSLDIICEGDMIEKILSAKKIGLKTKISGRDAGASIYLRTTDTLSVKMSVFAKLSAAFGLSGNQN